MALVAASILTAGTSAPIEHPRWAVRVSYDGFSFNHFLDQPNCHPLAYFLNDTAQLNYHHVLIHIRPGKTKDEAAHQTIGEVAGWKILQVTHKIDDGALYLRLLLVERHAGEFCEIYHQEYMGGGRDDPLNPYGVYQEVLPAYLVKVGGETLLAVRDPVSGIGNEFDEEYWSFDKDGPIDLCVYELIRDVAKKLLPEDWNIVKGDGFDVEYLSYTAPVREIRPDVLTGGNIQIQFALKNHRLIVVKQNLTQAK